MWLEFFSGLLANGIIYRHQGQDFHIQQVTCGGCSRFSLPAGADGDIQFFPPHSVSSVVQPWMLPVPCQVGI